MQPARETLLGPRSAAEHVCVTHAPQELLTSSCITPHITVHLPTHHRSVSHSLSPDHPQLEPCTYVQRAEDVTTSLLARVNNLYSPTMCVPELLTEKHIMRHAEHLQVLWACTWL